ncbi:MFS transporter [Nonomuraea pusilla]|uniref:Major Facilitator Superfamily protein n=1 Tax=Nonomuraea pusilla TaxID=46177 RepID=A0A1H7J373_9ACTN|nr:MFS transporter [Nonomuraea pusilla]SEK69213.1 Major Facilitator Superfamily protein [Nonomuraea pusilla]
MTSTAAGTVRFREVLAVREYRALWSSGLISRMGDQLARVALAVLAYELTGSATVTTFTYALTFVPSLLGGPLLGGLADRFPRRRVMVVCDVARALLVGLMALPQVPFPALCALLLVVQLIDAPEKTARIATTPDVLEARLYPAGVTLSQMTSQLTALAGFGAGGAIVTAAGPRAALAMNAASFALAALIVAAGVRHRPASRTGRAVSLRETAAGVRLVATDPRLRGLLGFALLATFSIAPEGLAVPYADALGGGAVAAGLLLCAIPAGSVVGMYLVNRLSAGPPALAPLAALSCLPLVVSAAEPGVAVSVAAWFLTGALSAYQVIANAEFVRLVPAERRGQAVGVAASALTAVQGVGVLLSGPLADLAGPAAAIAVYGAAGTIAALPLARSWRRNTTTVRA